MFLIFFGSHLRRLPQNNGCLDDPYWDNVVLMMHMDEDGFIDETGKIVTTYGNTNITENQAKFGGKAAYFDGVGDYLTFPVENLNDFTAECWVYLTNTNHCMVLCGSGNNQLEINRSNPGSVSWYINASPVISPVGTAVTVNAWHHLVYCREGSTCSILVDGVLIGTGTSSTAFPVSTIGTYTGYEGSYMFTGYLDELRITKGVGRYTSNSTKLLCHFDSSGFVDETGKTLTPFGNTSIVNTPVKFGSGVAYFDGTGDYISIPASTDFVFGTGDFTIECWIYPTENQTSKTIFSNRTGADPGQICVEIYATSNSVEVHTGTAVLASANSALPNNIWTHLAIVRKSGSLSIIYDGVTKTSVVCTNNFSTNTPVYIGGNDFSVGSFKGYIDEFHVTKGLARYVQFPGDVFLSHFLPYTIDTNFASKVFSKQGTMSIDNTSKYGTKSLLIPGVAGSILQFSDINLGASDFTIEAWFKVRTTGNRGLFSLGASGLGAYSVNLIAIAVYGTQLQCYHPNGSVSGGASFTVTDWNFISIQKANTTYTIYLNGSSYLTLDVGVLNIPNSILVIGAYYSTDYGFDGHIDEFRISNIIRPSTTPTTTLISDANTLFLASFESSEFPLYNIVEESGKTLSSVGNVSISSTQSKFGGSSVYFDGSGDYIDVAASSDFKFTGDFTVEGWVYPLRTQNYDCIFELNHYTDGIMLRLGSDVLTVNGNGGVNGPEYFPINTWTFFAVQRIGSTVYLIINSEVKNTLSFSGTVNSNGGALRIGNSIHGGSQFFYGYMDEFRISNGIAKYATISRGDVLLSHFEPVVIPADEPAKDILSTVGSSITVVMPSNIVCSGITSKIGNTSLRFIGYENNSTGIFINSLENNGLNTGPFTFESWIFPTFLSSNFILSNITGTTGYKGKFFGINSNGSLRIGNPYGAEWISDINTIVINKWTHVALTVENYIHKIYVNGVFIKTHDSAPSGYRWDGVVTSIGDSRNDHGAWFNRFTGFMDGINLTRSIKYTGNFIPSLDIPVTDANTVLMMECSGTPVDSKIVCEAGKIILPYENATISSTQSKFGGHSVYFDGTGDYLRSSIQSFGTEDFTIECWAYMTTPIRNQGILQIGSNGLGDYNNSTSIAFGGNGSFSYYAANSYYNAPDSYTINTWYHFALVRTNGVVYYYINGVLKDSRGDTVNYTGSTLIIGGYYSTNNLLNGYIDELRISKGVARYTANFNVPTQPFTLDEYVQTPSPGQSIAPPTTEFTYDPYENRAYDNSPCPPIGAFTFTGSILSTSNPIPPIAKFPSCRTDVIVSNTVL